MGLKISAQVSRALRRPRRIARRFAQESFQFGEGFLDRIHIGTVRRQIFDFRAAAFISSSTLGPLWLEDCP